MSVLIVASHDLPFLRTAKGGAAGSALLPPVKSNVPWPSRSALLRRSKYLAASLSSPERGL